MLAMAGKDRETKDFTIKTKDNKFIGLDRGRDVLF